MKALAAATEPSAEQAANRVLEEEGTTADALVAAFLAAAAERPSVLLSPVQALIAGPGVGARAFDGRPRQPGIGVARPRGVLPGQPVPGAARVAVPASLGALALLHAHDGGLSFQRLAVPALELARSLGVPERLAVLTKVGRMGASALRDALLARPLLAAAGRAEGGLLSEQDLADVRPETARPREVDIDAHRRALLTPWPAPGEPQRRVEVVVAADARGVLGALSYAPDDDGFAVAELGLTLPRDAVVVRRGVPRVAPGTPLPGPAPVALGIENHITFLALGVGALSPIAIAALSTAWSDHAANASQLLVGARDAAGGGAAVAVLRSPDNGRVQKLQLL